jgi:hypothetical protein
MYFVTAHGLSYHILEDAETGRAPSNCGARLSRFDLVRLHCGKPTRFVTQEKPADAPLCKHCQKARHVAMISGEPVFRALPKYPRSPKKIGRLPDKV